MNKFLAVVKREYLQRVRTKLFVIMTVLGPILLLVFTIVPTLMMNIKTSTTRIAVIDQTEGTKLFESVRDSLVRRDRGNQKGAQENLAETVNSNTSERMENAGKSLTGSFSVEPVNFNGRALDDVRRELSRKIARDELE